MKKEQREEARRLRREQGCSVKEICTLLGVSKSSVSVWVRDIDLTEEQRAALMKRHSGYAGQHKGSKAVRQKHLELRVQYQDEGRAKALQKDPLHIAGCMLYWAEGRKDRNSLCITNSDADMMQFYMRFLRESLCVENDRIRVYLNCYVSNGLSLEEIEDYWITTLQLSHSCLAKTVVNNPPASSQQKGRKLLYGVCSVSVHSTRLVNHVFGAIQEYAGIDKPEWLM
jgi:transcriptional regulator with XRE-family HTH domain